MSASSSSAEQRQLHARNLVVDHAVASVLRGGALATDSLRKLIHMVHNEINNKHHRYTSQQCNSDGESKVAIHPFVRVALLALRNNSNEHETLLLALQLLEGLVLLHNPSANAVNFSPILNLLGVAHTSCDAQSTRISSDKNLNNNNDNTISGQPSSALTKSCITIQRRDSGVELNDSVLPTLDNYKCHHSTNNLLSRSVVMNSQPSFVTVSALSSSSMPFLYQDSANITRRDQIKHNDASDQTPQTLEAIRCAALQLLTAVLATANPHTIKLFVQKCNGVDILAHCWYFIHQNDRKGHPPMVNVYAAEALYALQHNPQLDLSQRVCVVKTLERRLGRHMVRKLRAVNHIGEVARLIPNFN